ncbi:dynamin family protein [Lentzea sp. NPDC005914]|uniref:dynamin family protein n=1 Tax=Lentzea sp. NPDC005914 TaxID=3154572 RepID=UPI0033C302F5
MTRPAVSLPARVRSLLTEATAAYQGRSGRRRLLDVARHLDGPLRVAIAGRVKAGKSTLLNALVGMRVAATDAGECTRVVTWYGHGTEPRAMAFPRSGAPVGLGFTMDDGRHVPDLAGRSADDLDRIEVVLPSEWLTRVTLVDTPGMGSLSESAGRRTQEFLGERAGVDAVLYLLRHLHSSDVDFLEAFTDNGVGDSSPINAVGVLSRVDELGGGHGAPMKSAARIAVGYRADSRLRGLVHTVVPVAGLLAETAATLDVADFTALGALAAVDPAVLAPILRSAARFVAPSRAVRVHPTVRRQLLELLGLYGVRVCLDAIRAGTSSADELRAVLRDHSGLSDLLGLLFTQFAQRRDILKADNALRIIEALTLEDPIPAAPRLRAGVERLRAGAHEFAELRLLTELRLGGVPASPDQLTAMERLLGGHGMDPAVRLGIGPDSPPETAWAVVGGLLEHWRRVAQNPLSDPPLARAAQVLQRTCEGLSESMRRAQAPPPTPRSDRPFAPGTGTPG